MRKAAAMQQLGKFFVSAMKTGSLLLRTLSLEQEWLHSQSSQPEYSRYCYLAFRGHFQASNDGEGEAQDQDVKDETHDGVSAVVRWIIVSKLWPL